MRSVDRVGLYLRARGMMSRSVNMVMHPRGRYINIPVAVSSSGHARETTNLFEAVIHMQEGTHKVRKASLVVLRTMQLTLLATCRTPHDASGLVHAMFAWSAKSRHAPSRHWSHASV